jgi:hypothetical protein
MEKAADSTELVSPARTTLPWPYSQHSEVSDDAEKQPTMKTPPYRKKYFLPGSDDSSVDLVAAARGIEELQQRAMAYEQEEQMIKDMERKNELQMKLEMEKNELQMKLDIAKLKLELETIENNKNKENLN